MTNEYHGYRQFASMMKHNVVNHQEQFVDGETHTNTIEGFWSLIKRTWYGQHHHHSVEYTPFYVTERCYVYNARHLDCIWTKFINGSMRI